MTAKVLSPEKLEKQRIKRENEIKKWEREKARPRSNMYFIYLVLLISLIYATDEIASQIGTLMKTEIANDLFQNFGERSVGFLDILSILVVPFQAIGLLYRPLADRWGRKKFLLINTFGMSFAMLIIFLSNNILLYFCRCMYGAVFHSSRYARCLHNGIITHKVESKNIFFDKILCKYGCYACASFKKTPYAQCIRMA